MAGSSPREREVGSLWCSAYPRLVGVTSPDSCPHPFVNPFTRHSSLSSFLPSFLPSFLISNPSHRCSSLSLFLFIHIFTFGTHASLIYIYTPATGDRDVSSYENRWKSILWQERSVLINFWKIKRIFLRIIIDLIVKKKWWLVKNVVCKK